MKTIRQAAIDALMLAARNSRRIGDAPVMTLIEVVNALDAAGLLALPDSSISVRGGDTSPVMRELLADAMATASLLGSEGFTGIRLETQVRSLIAAWSEEREKVRRLRAAAQPLDPDAPIPYTVSEPPSNAEPEVAGGEPCPKCGEPLLANGECLDFPSCPSAVLPF